MKLFAFLFPLFFFIFSPASETSGDDLDLLIHWMTGTYSSAEQAAQDSAFYSINLVMMPIWEDRTDARYLYVEQAATARLNKPYRQRVYKVQKLENGLIESAVYLLPQADRFVKAWEKDGLFDLISPDSLTIRDGCSVFLKKDDNNCFVGSTKENLCKSTLYGASYATSEVQICYDAIISWDRGWNDNDEQVWGAKKGAYIFKKQ